MPIAPRAEMRYGHEMPPGMKGSLSTPPLTLQRCCGYPTIRRHALDKGDRSHPCHLPKVIFSPANICHFGTLPECATEYWGSIKAL